MNVAEAETLCKHEVLKQKRLRIRRAKQLLRPLPRKAPSIAPVLRWFADKARKRPYLWSFRKREVSLALYLGFVHRIPADCWDPVHSGFRIRLGS